jgi:hypothetical protein
VVVAAAVAAVAAAAGNYRPIVSVPGP